MDESFEALGRRLVRESRHGYDGPTRNHDWAHDRLRWGARGLSDDEVWEALLGALAETDRAVGDLWVLGDGFVAESVNTRPVLEQRLVEQRIENKDVAALFSVMCSPEHNPESAADWADPDWLARGREGLKRRRRRRPRS